MFCTAKTLQCVCFLHSLLKHVTKKWLPLVFLIRFKNSCNCSSESNNTSKELGFIRPLSGDVLASHSLEGRGPEPTLNSDTAREQVSAPRRRERKGGRRKQGGQGVERRVAPLTLFNILRTAGESGAYRIFPIRRGLTEFHTIFVTGLDSRVCIRALQKGAEDRASEERERGGGRVGKRW